MNNLVIGIVFLTLYVVGGFAMLYILVQLFLFLEEKE